MENNLEFYKQINFDELIKHGLDNGANVINEMPWSWKINGCTVTHENDNCYIVETMDGDKHFERGEFLMASDGGLRILRNHNTHCPGACPM